MTIIIFIVMAVIFICFIKIKQTQLIKEALKSELILNVVL